MNKTTASWILQIIAVAILLMAAASKFNNSEESVNTFTELHMEPHGRYVIGALEIGAALMLLIPASAAYGAILTAGIMSGAIIGHATKLPIGDIIPAVALLVISVGILILRKDQIPIINSMFAKDS